MESSCERGQGGTVKKLVSMKFVSLIGQDIWLGRLHFVTVGLVADGGYVAVKDKFDVHEPVSGLACDLNRTTSSKSLLSAETAEPPDAKHFLLSTANQKLQSCMKGNEDELSQKKKKKDGRKRRKSSSSSPEESESEDPTAVKQSVFSLAQKELVRRGQHNLDECSTKQIAYAFSYSAKFILPSDLYEVGGEQ
ncbi:hypothetical protein AK812_SmicGene47208, partial [Symbiodinium microadriaticum]